VSAPEQRAGPGASMRLSRVAAAVVEIAAFRDRAAELAAIAERRGAGLPPLGRVQLARDRAVIAVRPDRWLLLLPPAPAGEHSAGWQSACSGCAAVVDLSSAFAAFALAGPSAREVLARGCRLDLDPVVFPTGRAAATTVAQVSVVIATLPDAVLLLTPSTTARHFHEWLAATATPFGVGALSAISFASLFGDPFT
jgi:heterotetrameric sarcosine oxidase gamma subunit